MHNIKIQLSNTLYLFYVVVVSTLCMIFINFHAHDKLMPQIIAPLFSLPKSCEIQFTF
jgi:hypothetical protein